MINPITPEEVKLVIPDFIISIVNHLIKENFDGHEATFTQEEILDRIDYEDVGYTRREIFDHNFLDFEDLYKNVGLITVN